MREIKFRVFDKELKRMHIVGEDQHDSLTFYEENVEYYNLQNGEGSGTFGAYTLMQYTGLKDSNDKEIYEGDIVEYDNGIFSSVHVIEYERGQFIANGFWNTSQDEPSNLFSEYANKQSKIIGNIYESPELLEENK